VERVRRARTTTYNADDELTAGPTGSYTYDGAGNQTSSPIESNLSYNSKNQTSSATPSGGGAVALTYANNGQDERTGDGSTTFVSGNLGLDRMVVGGTTTYFIRNNVGSLIGEHVGSTSYYYLKDNEGSIVAVISSSGSVQDRTAYDPYGQVTSSSGSVSNPYGYAGGYTQGSGLVKFGARYYNPTVGSFTQEDASSETAGYLYAGNDPTNEIDPTGFSTTTDLLEDCGKGAVQGLAVGAFTGADATGVGAVGAAATGCATSTIVGVVGDVFGPTAGAAAEAVSDVKDVASVLDAL
jgi:RHS repeat-associated protein